VCVLGNEDDCSLRLPLAEEQLAGLTYTIGR
jgi:hypothetical protein